MALTDESGMNATMLVSPTGGIANNGGFGGFGGDWGWIVLLLLLFAGGGWGNGFGGNGAVPFAMGMNDVQSGFNQSSIMSSLGDINAGIYGLQNAICNGFSTADRLRT